VLTGEKDHWPNYLFKDPLTRAQYSRTTKRTLKCALSTEGNQNNTRLVTGMLIQKGVLLKTTEKNGVAIRKRTPPVRLAMVMGRQNWGLSGVRAQGQTSQHQKPAPAQHAQENARKMEENTWRAPGKGLLTTDRTKARKQGRVQNAGKKKREVGKKKRLPQPPKSEPLEKELCESKNTGQGGRETKRLGFKDKGGKGYVQSRRLLFDNE